MFGLDIQTPATSTPFSRALMPNGMSSCSSSLLRTSAISEIRKVPAEPSDLYLRILQWLYHSLQQPRAIVATLSVSTGGLKEKEKRLRTMAHAKTYGRISSASLTRQL